MRDVMIVPGRHGFDSAVWWVDAFDEVALVNGEKRLNVSLLAGGRPFADVRQVLLDDTHQRWLLAARGLPEGEALTLTVSNGSGATATITTRLLSTKATRFTIATGSCYALGHDDGDVARGYRAIRESRPVDLRVLTGDQIYMDYDPADGKPFATKPGAPASEPSVEPWLRYERQWRDARYRAFLSTTPTMMLGDDHDFWNDYPRKPAYLTYPTTVTTERLLNAFDVFQSSLNARVSELFSQPPKARSAVRAGVWRTVQFEAPLVSVMLFDTRTRRQPIGAGATLALPAQLAELTAWAKNLRCPGVLFLSQPLSESPTPDGHTSIDTEGLVDSALRHYPEQFRAICDAIAEAKHDVVVVSGDVHWSRLRALDLTRKNGSTRRVYEFVCSGLTETSDGDEASSGVIPEGRGRWIDVADAKGARVRSTRPLTMGTLSFLATAQGVEVTASLWWLRDAKAPLSEARFTLR